MHDVVPARDHLQYGVLLLPHHGQAADRGDLLTPQPPRSRLRQIDRAAPAGTQLHRADAAAADRSTGRPDERERREVVEVERGGEHLATPVGCAEVVPAVVPAGEPCPDPGCHHHRWRRDDQVRVALLREGRPLALGDQCRHRAGRARDERLAVEDEPRADDRRGRLDRERAQPVPRARLARTGRRRCHGASDVVRGARRPRTASQDQGERHRRERGRTPERRVHTRTSASATDRRRPASNAPPITRSATTTAVP